MTGREANAGITVESASMAAHCDPATRVATLRYRRGTSLTIADGTLLVDTLAAWMGSAGKPFAVLSDTRGVRGTDAAYRAHVGKFFRRHRETIVLALIHLDPLSHVVVEMFRIGTGVSLKCLADEPAARAWFRSKGFTA